MSGQPSPQIEEEFFVLIYSFKETMFVVMCSLAL